ncbi:MAG: lantibiotic dehydratase family protein, partial [Blastocatellia bacterium]|nr:lantibiotic dehydratase family protein [Blastocatellia bacterium]
MSGKVPSAHGGVAPRRPQSDSQSSHLLPLADTGWALWRWVALRGAGFPVGEVLKLASPGCSDLADRLLQAEEDLRMTRNQVMSVINESLDNLRRNSLWHDKDKRAPLLDALRLVSAGKVPRSLGGVADADAILSILRGAKLRADLAWQELRMGLERARESISGVIREEAADDRFREAVIWQNRRAFHTGISPLLRNKDKRNSKQRRYEEMAASYLQRYCVKNDTIGFHGPVGWARLNSHGSGIEARPGASLVLERNTYFEVWCIDSLAKAISKYEGVKKWIAPRLMAYIRLEGTSAHIPTRGAIVFSPEQAAIIRACDGKTTAKDLAARLVRDTSYGLADEQEVYDFLDLLESSELISWRFEVPMHLHPEGSLRQLLESIGDDELRRAALGSLDKLEDACEAVRRAAGDADNLDKALDNLETVFTDLTGTCATRSAGETYASRTIVFEDCRRNIEVDIGDDVINSFAPALSLLLTSARWLTFESAKKYREAFNEIYGRLNDGTGPVDFISFWLAAQPLFYDHQKSPANVAVSSFQKRWSEVLAIPEGERRVSYTSEELKPRVLAAFNAPSPGWSLARHHSPDLMIAAPSQDAINLGDCLFVLGELHMGVNTLDQALFTQHHPAPEELLQAMREDIPEPIITPVISKTNDYLRGARLTPTCLSPKDYWLECNSDPAAAADAKLLPMSSLVIEREGDNLVVRTLDQQLCFDLLEVVARFLEIYMADQFKLLRPIRHTPRVTIDRLVVCRESWNLSAFEAEFIYEKDDASRFVSARRWASSHGLPRFVFAKLPTETKPLYVDLDSPIYIDIFSRLARQVIDARPTAANISI